ncbi:helix-turn-helix transcriptional regulator [Streptomyces sp. IB2014 016-6]|uniref:helix-turn-helix domain-containing protein n=1 Tax=Streptomyces sp. IB2014 016-6 TaxID=2517818 RepID=UPI0011CB1C84|nr:helix-turn-helix transcriptional regulator [Streptomyces sp. IB2014 016-6]TXL91721.1 XRE family transcriptional regulator [Streptomyces sp. IB2014 016-6]
MGARKSNAGQRPSARQMLAKELARLREESGKSLATLGEETTYDRAYLHKLETGARVGSPEVIAALSAVYGAGEQLLMLWQLAREDAFADKYKRFMQLEAKATVRYEHAVGAIPGLLQTEGYAREVFEATRARDENDLCEEIAARLGRQELLQREDAQHFRAVLDESVLRRRTRDPKEWTKQLEHLLEACQLPNVTLQVLPFDAGPHGLMGTSVTILWLPDGKAVAYTEDAHSGQLIEDPSEVEKLRLSYDLLRDLALSPRDSVAFIERLLEENKPCTPDST